MEQTKNEPTKENKAAPETGKPNMLAVESPVIIATSLFFIILGLFFSGNRHLTNRFWCRKI